MKEFAKTLLAWYDRGHRQLPWRDSRNPYHIWLSEIMLQQTRTETVTGYYARFLEKFPTVEALAEAQEQEVLKAWEGLGYYSRARNLHKCAKEVSLRGGFPKDVPGLLALPGIGEYTAGAVASIAFDVKTPAVDGNVERVVSRVQGIREDVGIPSVRRELRQAAADLVDAKRPGDFNQAMMDLGARICIPGTPRCQDCPVSALCDAFREGDADMLPVKARKTPPKIILRGIALVIRNDEALLLPRKEKLLQGLWCFPGFDGKTEPEDIRSELQRMGVKASFLAFAGHARHVFTHRIWEMPLLIFSWQEGEGPQEGKWVTLKEMEELPRPAAMKGAEDALRKWMSEQA